MNKFALAAGIAVFALQAGACATVTRGTQEAWQVESSPSGARVETSHGYFCDSTPCAIRMPRESEFTATITKDGYLPVNVTVTHQTSGGGAAGMAGNVLVGGIIGGVIDANSWATQELTPNPVVVTLERDPAASAGGGGGIRQFIEDLFGL